jgi:hypothetical protein
LINVSATKNTTKTKTKVSVQQDVLKVPCLICLVDIKSSKCMTCPSSHAICFPCASTYTESISDFQNSDLHLQALSKSGRLKCPDNKCQQLFDGAKNVENVPSKFNPLLENLQRDFKEHVKQSALAKQRCLEEKHDSFKMALLPDLDMFTDDDVALNIIRRYIQEEILCIRCPNCSRVFADFSGCSNVSCVYPGCNAFFCGLCLKIGAHGDEDEDDYDDSDEDDEEDDNEDEEEEVMVCPADGPDSITSCWNLSRTNKVRQYADENLCTKSLAFKNRLSDLMKKDFQDLGLSFNF